MRRRRGQELKDRKAAEKAPDQIFLSPDDIKGQYAAARKLYTTLGGNGKRVITDDDLRQFKHEAGKLGKAFKGGITAKQVIDLSMQDRRDAAQSQIHYAVPMENRGGLVHFTTNSGPNSDVARYNVFVDLLGFAGAAAQPAKLASLARKIVEEPLKFDCDCADHRYRFRYIATAGKFNVGRDENGFPKLTNSALKGIACKHVLRVMRSLTSAPIQRKIIAMLEHARSDLESKSHKVSKAEAEAIAQHQDRQKGRAATAIETSTERNARLAADRAKRAAAAPRAVSAAAAEAKRKAAAASQAKAEDQAIQKLTAAPMTRAMRDRMITALKAAETID
jgi:hypothetical protein